MDTKAIVYSRNTVEFATVAKEYCAFLENANTHTRLSFITAAHKLLPLLYYKSTVLPDTEPILEETNEKFVEEDLYNSILNKLKTIFGQFDDFIEVNDPRADQNAGNIIANISEYLTDIYQDLKNFTMLYQVGNVEVMNDALWECHSNFKDFWGIRLANSIKALHVLLYTGLDLEQGDRKHGESEPDTSEWFITQRQKDFRK